MSKIETDPPRWRQVHAVIAKRIRSGDLTPGSRVPSLLDLTAEFEIASATAMKVVRQLRADGLIRTSPGIGSRVADPADWEPDASTAE